MNSGDDSAEARGDKPTRKRILRTPPEVMPALRAARNGMLLLVLTLCALAAFAALSSVDRLLSLALPAGVGDDLTGYAEKLSFAANVFVVLLLFRVPQSPIVPYGNLHSALVIQAAICSVTAVLHLTTDPLRMRILELLFFSLQLVGLAVPLFFFFYLVQLARAARDESLEELAHGALKRHVGFFLAVFLVLLTRALQTSLVEKIGNIAIIVLALDYVGYVLRLAYDVVMFRPVPAAAADEDSGERGA